MMPDASIAEMNVAAELITAEYVRYHCQERTPTTTKKRGDKYEVERDRVIHARKQILDVVLQNGGGMNVEAARDILHCVRNRTRTWHLTGQNALALHNHI